MSQSWGHDSKEFSIQSSVFLRGCRGLTQGGGGGGGQFLAPGSFQGWLFPLCCVTLDKSPPRTSEPAQTFHRRSLPREESAHPDPRTGRAELFRGRGCWTSILKGWGWHRCPSLQNNTAALGPCCPLEGGWLRLVVRLAALVGPSGPVGAADSLFCMSHSLPRLSLHPSLFIFLAWHA